eukprot:gene53312-66650_t
MHKHLAGSGVAKAAHKEEYEQRVKAFEERKKKAEEEQEEIRHSVHDECHAFLATRTAEEAQKDLWAVDIVMNDDCPSRIESPYFIDAHGQIEGFGRREMTSWIVTLSKK